MAADEVIANLPKRSCQVKGEYAFSWQPFRGGVPEMPGIVTDYDLQLK